jgi:hypothetical protein
MALEQSPLTNLERKFVAEALLDDVISSLERDQGLPDRRELESLEGGVLRFQQGHYEDACIQIATAAALIERRQHSAMDELHSQNELNSDSVAALRNEFEAARKAPDVDSCTAAINSRSVIAALRRQFEAARRAPDVAS